MVTKYIKLCTIDDLPEGHGKKVKIGRHTIAVFKYRDKVYAFQNACPHQSADLSKGYIRDRKLYCRLHHWAFELESGAYLFNPHMSIHTYTVHIENGIVYLELTQKSAYGKKHL